MAAKSEFTAKSGGHTAFSGGSNTDKGVTIDLIKLNEVSVSKDRKTASIGPGNRWGDVYKALDPHGLAVVGGRVSTVGVGGLLLGGGISWFSGKKGLACDHVRAYEVVLSSGEVVIASPTKNKDLYRALRGGGGSNFGIVTRFDLVASEQDKFWGQILYLPGQLDQTIIPLYTDMVKNQLHKDPGAHSYLVLTYDPDSGAEILFPYFSHTTVPSDGGIPAIFQPYQSLPNAFVNQTIVDRATTHALAVGDVFGNRQGWWTTSVKVKSTETFLKIAALHKKHLDKLIKAAGSSYMTSVLELQPMTSNMLEAGVKNGGNSLGLRPKDGPFMVIAWNPRWQDSKFDRLVEKTANKFIAEVEKLAKKEKVYEAYKYMNYASVPQEVLKSYGKENYVRLKRTAEKYDPKQLLKKYWKGYYKL